MPLGEWGIYEEAGNAGPNLVKQQVAKNNRQQRQIQEQ
jgi:hypothetical protein